MTELPEPGLTVQPDQTDHGESLAICSGSTVLARIKPRTEEEYRRDEAILNRLAACYTVPASDEELEAAREEYADDDINIDDGAGVSHADGGYWVQAWVFVSVPEDEDV